MHEWCYVELADLSAEEHGGKPDAIWTRGLLVRRQLGCGTLAFFSTWCPAGTPLARLVGVEGHRWSIEDSFETAKNELGLDHNETRSWHGRHHHVCLVMLAFAMMASIRHKANALTATPKKHCGCGAGPLVAPGDPARRHPACPTQYRARTNHCMVTLATRPPGHGTSWPTQKSATVMLGRPGERWFLTDNFTWVVAD